ncbi:hypothetical protein ACQWU4_14420 [Chryseobacterium sp. MIQD13]|uniref:hypothetical protein n=1 Tax=Chryseobacterium sp. MIQD13 TaxID=3422310 RepID=UPI003D294176
MGSIFHQNLAAAKHYLFSAPENESGILRLFIRIKKMSVMKNRIENRKDILSIERKQISFSSHYRINFGEKEKIKPLMLGDYVCQIILP